MSVTRLARVKQWQVFARTWWVYDAKWQDPWDSGQLIGRYLVGKHKPIYDPHIDCGDHVVVINTSQIALPNQEWKWRHFFHNTQWAGGVTWASAWERHLADPTFVMERAIYKYCGRQDARLRAFSRVILRRDDNIPDDIREKISGQIRQIRPVPQKLNEISQQDLDNYPKLFDFDKVDH